LDLLSRIPGAKNVEDKEVKSCEFGRIPVNIDTRETGLILNVLLGRNQTFGTNVANAQGLDPAIHPTL
jgi:hypothetical protein